MAEGRLGLDLDEISEKKKDKMVLRVCLIQPKNIYIRRAKLYKDRYLELQNIQYHFKKYVFYFHQSCIYLIKNTVQTVIL